MAKSWRTVRVFISSTFRDMHAERDHLIKAVFPAVRERLEAHRIHLVDIDLRWGVTAEQADSDRVLELCLDEIKKSWPFFIGILGQRYGWVPKTVPEAAVKRHGWLSGLPGKSITELEILHGVLNDPKMRMHALFYFREDGFLAQVPKELKDKAYQDEHADKLAAVKEAIRRHCASYGAPLSRPRPGRRRGSSRNAPSAISRSSSTRSSPPNRRRADPAVRPRRQLGLWLAHVAAGAAPGGCDDHSGLLALGAARRAGRRRVPAQARGIELQRTPHAPDELFC